MSTASESEGEIIETEGNKANSALPHHDISDIDRLSSSPSSTSSAALRYDGTTDDPYSYRSRSRSPYRHRSPRQQDSRRPYGNRDGDRDPRQFHVRYDERSSEGSRRHRHYDDSDRAERFNSTLSYDDRGARNRYRDHNSRNRSRSPRRNDRRSRRHDQGPDRRDGHGRRDPQDRRGQRDSSFRDRHQNRVDDRANQRSREQSVSDRGHSRSDVRTSAPSEGQGATDARSNKSKSSRPVDVNMQDVDMHDATAKESAATEVPEPIDEAALIEERRKRRQLIKAKYDSQPLLVQVLDPSTESAPTTPAADSPRSRLDRSESPFVSSPKTPQIDTEALALAIKDDNDLSNHAKPNANVDDGPSAADYDPTMDMQEDKARYDRRTHHEEPTTNVQEPQAPVQETQPKKKDKSDFDMFADDDDDDDVDMFASQSSNSTNNPTSKNVSLARTLDMGMLDNWDDSEGFYRIILGELLDGRYHVQELLGKGMYANVIRAMDMKSNKMVAVKMIRNNDSMRKSGMQEIELLQKLVDADPEDKKHVIRIERYFDHKNHLCIVFENMNCNLREVLKKFGRNVGLTLEAVRSYAAQMFLGLSLMRKCNILHADLKPDNILVNESKAQLKICDLGSGADVSDYREPTPYLVSRFYRAPEIILAMPLDHAIDTWSIGCTLFELYTGKILFTGRNNNQMLRSIMECRGKIGIKMLKKGQLSGAYFDDNLNFMSSEYDKVTGKEMTRIISVIKPTSDLKTRILSAAKQVQDADEKRVLLFFDLLDRCLQLNPEKRITPLEALKHPFIKGEAPKYPPYKPVNRPAQKPIPKPIKR